MRFLLYDRLLEIVPGERVRGVKQVSLTEEYLREHYPRAPRVPPSLVLEAMIQVVGGLVMASHEWRVLPFLTLVEDAQVSPDLRPGARIEIEGALVATNPQGTVARAIARVEGAVVAEAGRILYGHFPAPDPAALRARFEALGVLP